MSVYFKPGVSIRVIEGLACLEDLNRGLLIPISLKVARTLLNFSPIESSSNDIRNSGYPDEKIVHRYRQFLDLRKSNPGKFDFDLGKIRFSSPPNAFYRWPTSILYHVTDKCDKQCIYCYNRGKRLSKNMLHFYDFKKAVKNFCSVGVIDIIYSGGEPFVHPDIVQMLNFASDCGINNRVTTKHFFEEKELATIKDPDSLIIDYSMDMIPDQFQYYYYSDNNHNKKMRKSMEAMFRCGIEFTLRPVITRNNIDCIDRMVDLIERYGIDIIVSRFKSNGFNKELEVGKNDWEQFTNAIAGLSSYYREKISYYAQCDKEPQAPITLEGICKDYFVGCANGKTSAVMFEDGSAALCEHAGRIGTNLLGSFVHDAIEDIWNSSKREAFISNDRSLYTNQKCSTCDVFRICNKKSRCSLSFLKEQWQIKKRSIESLTQNKGK